MTSFFISDTHFGHANILTFKREDGTPLRHFSSAEEMDETMVENWNRTVGKNDRVYHLGDVVIHRRYLPILSRLNGRKVLVRGNHDIFRLKDFLPYFEDIRGYKVFPEHRIIASHIPIHPQSLDRWRANIHGHLHSNKVKEEGSSCRLDMKYVCVSVEQINYTPISLEDVLAKIEHLPYPAAGSAM